MRRRQKNQGVAATRAQSPSVLVTSGVSFGPDPVGFNTAIGVTRACLRGLTAFGGQHLAVNQQYSGADPGPVQGYYGSIYPAAAGTVLRLDQGPPESWQALTPGKKAKKR